MLPIMKNCSKGYNISACKNRKLEWIVIHYFGALGSAKDNCQYFVSGNRDASADFLVDDEEIWQFNPDIKNYYTWHCGGGLQGYIRHSKYGICKNVNSIGIEMRPYNDKGQVQSAQNAGWYFHEKTINNTIDLVKYLMKTYNIDANHVIMHADVTGKYCPAPFLDDISKWNDFINKVKGTTNVQPAKQDTTTKLYRIRKSWNDSASQIGAYSVLENAIAECKKHNGYVVYDNKGLAVYPFIDEFKIRVDVSDLHIRAGAGTSYASKGYIPKGIYTIVQTMDAEGYIWGKLKSNVGWIALDFTQKL